LSSPKRPDQLWGPPHVQTSCGAHPTSRPAVGPTQRPDQLWGPPNVQTSCGAHPTSRPPNSLRHTAAIRLSPAHLHEVAATYTYCLFTFRSKQQAFSRSFQFKILYISAPYSFDQPRINCPRACASPRLSGAFIHFNITLH
jgi:hypothetical protein